MPNPYGPGTPVVSGVGDMTVDEFLDQPTVVIQRTIEAIPNQYYIGDVLLRTGPANAGVVVSSKLKSTDMFVNSDLNRQPGIIAPGSEFPAVDIGDTFPTVSLVDKRGGYFPVTYEERRRDRRDVIARGLLRLSNTLVAISNARILTAVLTDADILATQTTAATAVFDAANTTTILSDIYSATSRVDDAELGYSVDTAIAHPDAIRAIAGNAKIQDRLPRELRDLSPVFNKKIDGVGGVNWIASKRMDRTKIIFTSRQMVGYLGQEIAPYSRVIDNPKTEEWFVQAARVEVPVITDPLSTFVLTGVLT